MINYIKKIFKMGYSKQELGQIHDSIKEKTYLLQENTSILDKEILLGTQFLNVIMQDAVKRNNSYAIIPEIKKEITKQETLARRLEENNINLIEQLNVLDNDLQEKTKDLINLQTKFVEKCYQRNNILINTINEIMYSDHDELTVN